MCSLDLDPCDVWNERPLIARKRHECDGCGAEIQPGSPYLAHSNLFEGEWSREKMCAPCWFAREEFADAHGESFSPSTLIDRLHECIVENEEDEWRPVLASVLARYRVSACRKRARKMMGVLKNVME